jgi:hypothetical protein
MDREDSHASSHVFYVDPYNFQKRMLTLLLSDCSLNCDTIQSGTELATLKGNSLYASLVIPWRKWMKQIHLKYW